MLKYFSKRLGLMLITFSIVIFIFFAFIHMLPDYNKSLGNDPLYDIIREREGLDKPIIIQFFYWLRNIFVSGDFGFSAHKRQSAGSVVFSKIPNTLAFQIVPYIITVPLGIMLGVVAALYKNKTADNVISVGIMVLISIPTFVLAVVFQLIFYWKLHWAPSLGVASPSEFKANALYGISTYIMPTIVMVFGGIAGWARSIRAELTEQLTQDYMLLARSKGLSKRQAVYRHALKNALVPFAPAIFLGFLGLISGSIILETIFKVDGVGKVYLTAFSQKDYPVLLLNMVFFEFLGLITSILADMSYTILDPRVRIGSGK